MKNLILTLVFMSALVFNMKANDADLFNLDYNAVQTEFAQLNQIGDMVAANPELTYSSLLETNSNLVESTNLAGNSALPIGSGDPVLGITSFLWGCVLGVIGMAVVYIASDQDMSETKKSLWGCIVGYVVGGVLYFVAYGAAWSLGG